MFLVVGLWGCITSMEGYDDMVDHPNDAPKLHPQLVHK
jgi:hypothetical protein